MAMLNLPRGRMDSGTLNKECHRDDEPNAHEKDCIPVGLKRTDDLMGQAAS